MSKMTGGTARIWSTASPPRRARAGRPQPKNLAWSSRMRRSPFLLCVPSRCGREGSSRAFEPLQSLVDLQAARLGLLAFLALAFDHVRGRAPDELGIGELGVDAGDVGLHPRQLFLQARFLGRDVDHALERQRRHLAPNDKLNRSLWGAIYERNIGQTRKAP